MWRGDVCMTTSVIWDASREWEERYSFYSVVAYCVVIAAKRTGEKSLSVAGAPELRRHSASFLQVDRLNSSRASSQMPLFQSKDLVAFHSARYPPSTPSILQSASSSLRGYVNVASSSLSVWTSDLVAHLPDSIQHLIRVPQSSNISSLDQLYSLISTHSTTTYTTLFATLLALIYLAAKYLMTSYRNSYDGGWGGRGSPYASGVSRNVSDYVEYITGSNELLSESTRSSRNSHHIPSISRPHDYQDPDDAPDKIQIRHKAEEFTVLLQPFAISDGLLLVGDLRKYAAEKLHTDPRRVRLLYKGKKLVDDRDPAKRYGLKQNSEISCVIIEATGNALDSDGSEDGSTASSNQDPRRTRPRGQSNVRHRSQEDVSVKSDFLHPSNATAPRQQERPTRHDSLGFSSNHDRHRSHSRAPSPNPSSTSSLNTSFKFTPPVFAPNVDPNTPMGKLSTLSETFYTKWLPLCDKYIRSPPAEPREREKECKKLNESILAQIVLQLDNVDVQGDQEARTVRKGLVNRANEVMRMVDEKNWEVNPKN